MLRGCLSWRSGSGEDTGEYGYFGVEDLRREVERGWRKDTISRIMTDWLDISIFGAVRRVRDD